MWVTEEAAAKLIGITPAATLVAEISTYSASDTGTATPRGITTGPDGDLWFTKGNPDRSQVNTDSINQFDISTQRITRFGALDHSEPWGITVGSDGNLWFTERNASSIGVMPVESFGGPAAPPGGISTIAGNGRSQSSGDGGFARDAGLSDPSVIIVDPYDNLFVVDGGNRPSH